MAWCPIELRGRPLRVAVSRVHATPRRVDGLAHRSHARLVWVFLQGDPSDLLCLSESGSRPSGLLALLPKPVIRFRQERTLTGYPGRLVAVEGFQLYVKPTMLVAFALAASGGAALRCNWSPLSV